MSAKITTTRRSILLTSVAALPVVALPLAPGSAKGLEATDLRSYRTVFFTADEWSFVLAVCDRLIPTEGRGPGALETNVPVFIDQQLQDGLGSDIYLQGPFKADAPTTLGFQIEFAPQQVYRLGIRLTQQQCQAQFGKRFEQLGQQQQDGMLTALEKNGVDFASLGQQGLKASEFFGQVLGDAKNGWLADPKYGGNKDMKAWVGIGFPGARAAYSEWVDQHDHAYPLGPVSLSGRRA